MTMRYGGDPGWKPEAINQKRFMMFDHVLEDFVTLWVVIDPIGTIPVFLAFTAQQAASERRRTALRAILIAFAILVVFIIAGQLLIEALGVHLAAFQIAGGLVLFIFALTMIFGESKPEQETQSVVEENSDVAVFPLAVPSIASPGAMMAVVLLTDNHRFEPMDQAVTTAVMISILVVAYLLLLLAVPLQRLIGLTGASIISRVMGLILAAVAVDNVLSAFKSYFSLP
jgi:multiple antibiotic resistance protein